MRSSLMCRSVGVCVCAVSRKHSITVACLADVLVSCFWLSELDSHWLFWFDFSPPLFGALYGTAAAAWDDCILVGWYGIGSELFDIARVVELSIRDGCDRLVARYPPSLEEEEERREWDPPRPAS